MSEMISIGDAARQLGVHRDTLKEWWRRGLVELERNPGPRGRWWISREQLARCRIKPTRTTEVAA